MEIFIAGPQASGKSTLAEKIAEQYGEIKGINFPIIVEYDRTDPKNLETADVVIFDEIHGIHILNAARKIYQEFPEKLFIYITNYDIDVLV